MSYGRHPCRLAWSALAIAALCAQPEPAAAVETITPTILASHPHDTSAFTEGLVYYKGSLYESTGNYGASTLRQVDPMTGSVTREISLDGAYFGEGLAQVGNRLIQLTWKEHAAFGYDLGSFAKTGQFTYSGEGWGLCFDGTRLVMSNGSDVLEFRDPVTFAVTGSVAVTLDGSPLTLLNELECVGGMVYANVWTTNVIVRIDPTSGRVTQAVSCAGLLTPSEAQRADVLNGIAFNPTTGTFFVTGKYWPWLFEARFGELAPAADGAMPDTGPKLGDAVPAPTSDGAPGNAARRSGRCSAAPTPIPIAALLVTVALACRRRRRP